MLNRLPVLLPTAAVLAVAFVLACGDSTGPSVPQYPHSATSVRLVSGDGQSGLVGSPMPQPIVLEVLDSVGQPAWGRVIGQGMDTATTDRNGRATIRGAAFSTAAGAYTLDLEPQNQATSDRATHAIVHATAIARPFERIDTAVYSLPTSALTTTRFRRDQLFAPVDTFGNVVPWPATTWSLPPGWATSGDTLIPPYGLAPGRYTIGIQAGGAAAQRTVLLMDDLRQYHWNVSWACGGGHPNAYFSDDSMSFTGTVRRILYPGDSGFVSPQKGTLPLVQALVDVSYTTVLPDGSSSTRTATNAWEIGMTQTGVDTLTFPWDANIGTVTGKIAVRGPGALPSYTGGSWCDPTYYDRRWPVKLTAY